MSEMVATIPSSRLTRRATVRLTAREPAHLCGTRSLPCSEPNWTVIDIDDTHMVNLNDPEGAVEVLLSLL